MKRLRIRLSTAALAFAVFGLLATTLTIFALLAPRTGLAGSLGLAPVFELRADTLARSAGTDENARLGALGETRRSLAQAPANPTAWLRLAYLDSVSQEGLTGQGDRALAASYAIAPYGPDVTTWRLAFAFNHWDSISADNRRAALDELSVASSAAEGRSVLNQVSNPAGRIALSLTVETMERERNATQRPV